MLEEKNMIYNNLKNEIEKYIIMKIKRMNKYK